MTFINIATLGWAAMSPRARVYAVVAAAAALAVAAVAGGAYLQTRGETTTAPGAVTKPRAGVPPLLFDFGVQDDAQAQSLSRGAQLLQHGKKQAAAAIFERYHSVQAQIGVAFARWPDRSLDTVKEIVAANPRNPVAQLHLGLALYWTGRSADAVKQLQLVDSRFPDSRSAVDAEDLLYAGRFFPGLPYMIAAIELPKAPTLAGQLELAKRTPLVYGVMLWRLDRRLSARHALDAAAAAAPNDPLALTLAAVAHFTKKQPSEAFGRLGPLTGRFPRSSVVRLHLGVLLLWERQVKKGAAQLRLAAADEPGSIYAQQAKKLLSALVTNGTK
jgi:tetratricopeptide (TPR) repeat protein